MATSLLAATLVGLVLTQPKASTPQGSRVADPVAAMAFFGLDRRLALVTDDGIMAVRTGEGDPASIAVALISQTADGYAWRTLATTTTPTGSVVRSRVDVKTLSCNSGAGLAQPDLVFGFIRVPDGHLLLDVRPMAGTDQVRGTWDVTAFGTRHAGFFIYALRPGYQPPADGFELLVIDQHDVSRPDASTVPVAQERLPVSVPASSFTHDDQCNGESLDQ